MSEYREGQTATNPKTGQKVVFKGGQWVNAGGAMPPRQSAPVVKQQMALQGKARGAESVERALNDLQKLYDRDFKGVGPGSLLEYLPTQRRSTFDAAAEGLRPLLKPMIRDPGEGAFTEGDQALLDRMIPNGGMMDGANEQRFKNIRGMISDAYRNSGKRGALSPTIKRVR